MSQSSTSAARLAREKQTISAMVQLYCRGRHGCDEGLCGGCQELLDYALGRLDRCPFGSRKPTCHKCPIHCYKPQMRAAVQEMMRYAGPRMILRHPMLSVLHQLDALGRRTTGQAKQ